jgi:hypothetical protein
MLEAVSELENHVMQIKGNVAMFDLMQEIRAAKTSFIKEIELVLNWFRIVGSDDDGGSERLAVVVDAAVSAFDSLFRHKGKELSFVQGRSDVRLTYRESRALFISLFTALENALKYGRSGIRVDMSLGSTGTADFLKIANIVADDQKHSNEFIGRQKAKWTDANSKLSTMEGGSGLYKIHNLLTNSSPGFHFDIEINNDVFILMIELNHEYFSDRRQFA